MRIIILLTLLSLPLISLAQENIDSLRAEWNNKKQTDSLRLDAVHQLAFEVYRFRQPDSAKYYAQKQLEFAKAANLKYQTAQALNTLGSLAKNDLKLALSYHNESLKLREEIGDSNGISGSLNNIGAAYVTVGLKSKGLNYYKRALKLAEQAGYLRAKGIILGNIGSIYEGQKDYDAALVYIEMALESLKEQGKENEIAYFVNLSSKANIYINQEKYEDALVLINQCLEFGEKNQIQGIVSISLMQTGAVYLKQKHYEKALDRFYVVLKIFEESKNRAGAFNVHLGIGLLNIEKNNYSDAIKECKMVYLYTMETKNIGAEKEACNCLYKANKALGNGMEALRYYERIQAITDSLTSAETTKKLQGMEFEKELALDSMNSENEKLEMELGFKEELQEKQQVQNRLMVAGILALLLAGAFYGRMRITKKAKTVVEREKKRSDELLLNILPAEVAEELKNTGASEAKHFDEVSILFTDFKGFTQASEKLSPKDLVNEINTCFKAFDNICDKYGIEKIKTIGDSYMAVAGLKSKVDGLKSTSDIRFWTRDITMAALEMQAFITDRSLALDTEGQRSFQMRCGIHTGPVVAGIVGIKKFQYDIWGDTVNTASRMESHGEVGKVNISEETYQILRHSGLDPESVEFAFEAREMVNVKGKGDLAMFFVKLNEGPDDQTKV